MSNTQTALEHSSVPATEVLQHFTVLDLKTGQAFDEEQLLQVIEQCHQVKEYRPVVAVILRNQENKLLLVKSAKPPHDWGFLQGGIDRFERLLPSLSREAREEVNLDEKDIHVEAFLGTAVLDAPANRVDKRGFTKGKQYFYFTSRYTGNSEFKLQVEEIQEAAWVTNEEALELISGTRGEKAQLMKEMMRGALQSTDKSST